MHYIPLSQQLWSSSHCNGTFSSYGAIAPSVGAIAPTFGAITPQSFIGLPGAHLGQNQGWSGPSRVYRTLPVDYAGITGCAACGCRWGWFGVLPRSKQGATNASCFLQGFSQDSYVRSTRVTYCFLAEAPLAVCVAALSAAPLYPRAKGHFPYFPTRSLQPNTWNCTSV
jgi:hypothetical protein